MQAQSSATYPALPDTFWGYVALRPGGCWEWQGARDLYGYGHLTIRERSYSVHRLVFAQLTLIPAGLYVCHHCDNPPCLRGSHLFLGDQFANMADKMAKGRHVAPGPHGGHHHNPPLPDDFSLYPRRTRQPRCVERMQHFAPTRLPRRPGGFLTIPEASRATGWPEATLRYLIHHGQLPAERWGAKAFAIAPADLLALNPPA